LVAIATGIAIAGRIRRGREEAEESVARLDPVDIVRRFRESAQFQELEQRSAQLGFQGPEQAVQQIRQALSQQEGEISQILQRTGAKDLDDLNKKIKENREAFRGLRDELVEAFITDLGRAAPEAAEQLDKITGAAQRASEASRLVALAAFSSTALINQRIRTLKTS
jgi:hypothetical protein